MITGVIFESIPYIDEYAVIYPENESLWTKTKLATGYKITGYTGIGEQLNNVVVPNLFKENDENIPVVEVALKNINFTGTITFASNIKIKDGTLVACTTIDEIIIGDNVTISSQSFKNCTSLKTVTIGNNVTIVGGTDVERGNGTFGKCTNLKTVTMGENIIITEGVKSIGAYAFKDCTGLTTIAVNMTQDDFTNNVIKGIGWNTNVTASMSYK